MKLNCAAERHHYSMFNAGRSMFDDHLSKQLRLRGDAPKFGFNPPR
jgi:hypothetical protein